MSASLLPCELQLHAGTQSTESACTCLLFAEIFQLLISCRLPRFQLYPGTHLFTQSLMWYPYHLHHHHHNHHHHHCPCYHHHQHQGHHHKQLEWQMLTTMSVHNASSTLLRPNFTPSKKTCRKKSEVQGGCFHPYSGSCLRSTVV